MYWRTILFVVLHCEPVLGVFSLCFLCLLVVAVVAVVACVMCTGDLQVPFRTRLCRMRKWMADDDDLSLSHRDGLAWLQLGG
jgi:hypothetical protein